jgi:hypothetical protein
MPGAQIGIHSAYAADGTPAPAGTAAMGRFLLSVGAPREIVQAMWSTAPDQMHWLTEDEKKVLGIVTLQPGKRPGS